MLYGSEEKEKERPKERDRDRGDRGRDRERDGALASPVESMSYDVVRPSKCAALAAQGP